MARKKKYEVDDTVTLETKLTKQNKNNIRLMNQLNRSFVKAFPGLKNDPKFKPLKIKDIEKEMRQEARKQKQRLKRR